MKANSNMPKNTVVNALVSSKLMSARHSVSCCKALCLLLICMILMDSSAFAQSEPSIVAPQHEHTHKLTGIMESRIAFGEKPILPFLQDPNMRHCSWLLYDAHNKIIARGADTSIATYVFDTPGQYSIHFSLNPAVFDSALSSGHCFHPSIPARVDVSVAAQKIVFVLNEIRLAQPLLGGVEQAGNILYVPAVVSTYRNKAFSFANAQMRTAGVGANVRGKLAKDKSSLSPGRQELAYHLQGTVLKGSYIMIDFEDPVGNIQSIAWTEKIN